MYVIIGDARFDAIRSITFAPAVDMTGNRLSVNEFTVEINTQKSVYVGKIASLFDDRGILWARYRVQYAEHVNRSVLKVVARSLIGVLDQRRMGAEMYSDKSVAEALEAVFEGVSDQAGVYRLDGSYAGATLTGFVPEQTARKRLQWICYALGAYVSSAFGDVIEIRPRSETAKEVAFDRTFWRPNVTHGDYVTALSATVYSFAQGVPQTTDEYVQDAEGETYIVSKQNFTLTNPDAPGAAPPNVVNIDRMYLINGDNVSDILTHLGRYYFARTAVQFDALNNAEFAPGDRVRVHSDALTMYEGYVESSAFKFGVQARSANKMTALVVYNSMDDDGREPELAEDLVWAEFWDGLTLLYKTTVHIGDTPVYGGETPTREGDTFLGWEPEPGPIEVDTAYYAQWENAGDSSAEIPDNMVWAIFKDGDIVLQKSTVASGETPAYTAEAPTRENDTFIGWKPEIGPITQDTTFYAQWEVGGDSAEDDTGEEVFDLLWAVFRDGLTFLLKTTVASGEAPVYTAEEPTREGDAFTGWKPPLAPIYADTTFYAQWEIAGDSGDVLPEGMVWAIFISGHTILQKNAVAVGDTPAFEGDPPTRENDEFLGWRPELAPIYEDTQFYAIWKNSVITLTIVYFCGTLQLDKKTYTFPAEYIYSITNPYFDRTHSGHRYIYRPLEESAEGTMGYEDTEDEEEYAVALDLTLDTKQLHIISVDAVEVDEGEEITVGAIK